MRNGIGITYCNVSKWVFITSFFLIMASQVNAITWTGSANDGNWHTAGNWDTNAVPNKFDHVFIFGAIPYNITISSLAQCQRMTIGIGVSRVLINPTGALSINGQATVNEDLLRIAEGTILQNHGNIVITNLQTNLDQEAIDLSGKLINEVNASITITNVGFSAPNWDVLDREAILVRELGEFENDGDVEIDEIDGNAIIVKGRIRNTSNGKIILGDSIRFAGIRAEGGSSTKYFDNYGEIHSSMNESIQSTTIVIASGVKAYNYGLIRIENSTAPIKSIKHTSNFNNSLFGNIEIVESSGIEIGESGAGIVNFVNDGFVTLSRQINPSGTAISIKDGGTLVNDRNVSVTGYSSGIGTTLAANINNNETGTISVTQVSGFGISNAGEISNYGSIIVDNCGTESFRNLYIVVNFPSGIIEVTNAPAVAIRNFRLTTSHPSTLWDNYGIVNISAQEDGIAIYNWSDSIFRNRGKVNVVSNSRIYNLSNFEILDTINVPLFENGGNLKMLPSSTDYVFTGDLRLSLGEIEFSIASTSNYDQIKVNGDVHLDGDVDIQFGNGFMPSSFHTFDLIHCEGNRSGFIQNLISNASSLDHILYYGTQQDLQLKYSECGASSTPRNIYNSGSGNWSDDFRWSLGHVPYPCEQAEINGSVGSPAIITMDLPSEEISRLQLNNHTELIIPQGNELIVNRSFKTTYGAFPGKEAVILSELAKISNQGSLKLMNVQEGEIIENAGMIVNDGSIIAENGTNVGIRGIFNTSTGLFTNSENSELRVRNLENNNVSTIYALVNSGIFVENGHSFFDYPVNNFDTGNIEGSGIITVSELVNSASISPGNSVGLLTIDGDLTLTSNSEIVIEIEGDAGAGFSGGHDRIVVINDLRLNGKIQVNSLLSEPQLPTDEYKVVQYLGGKLGDFSQKVLNGEYASWTIVDDGAEDYTLLLHADCLNKTIEWDGDQGDNLWTSGRNWQYNRVPMACHTAIISPKNQVEIPILQSLSIGYLEIDQSSLSISTGSLLNLYGNNASFGILQLHNSTVVNSGKVNIYNSDANNPGLFIDDQSELLNKKTINVLSKD